MYWVLLCAHSAFLSPMMRNEKWESSILYQSFDDDAKCAQNASGFK
jgi:hypothetical protein